MLRHLTTALAALALSLPLAATAETASEATDSGAPEVMVVAAAEDAVVLPAPRTPRVEPAEQPEPRRERLVPHGSSQSAAGFRFTNPYAVPQQTLPIAFPALTAFSF